MIRWSLRAATPLGPSLGPTYLADLPSKPTAGLPGPKNDADALHRRDRQDVPRPPRRQRGLAFGGARRGGGAAGPQWRRQDYNLLHDRGPDPARQRAGDDRR